MILHNPPPKPNEPIFLENTTITHIESHCLPTPCLIQVVLHLSPTITCRIESDNLPIQLLNDYMHKPFSAILNNSCEIKMQLSSYDLNSNKNSRDTFKGSLIPYKSPFTVVQSDTQIQSVNFSILNFRRFYGSQDKWVEVNENCLQLGAAEMKCDGWQIDITETPTFSENWGILRQNGGYVITHIGLIKHLRKETFSVEEAGNVLCGLRAFLSFSSGSACGLTLVKGIDQDDRELILEWGTTHAEPWNQGDTAWLPKADGGDSLSQLFPGFWCLYNDSNWHDTIHTVIDWYLNSNGSAFHVGIVLSQTALESLFYKIIGTKLSARKIRNLSAAEKLKNLLKEIGIDKEIPSSCEGLKKFSDQKIKQKKDGSAYLGDGPEAIVEIRNDLVHPKKEYDHISAEAQMDASRLSRWYIELILLKKFGYCGRYTNRLRSAGEDPYQYVPWANENIEAATTK